jgi:hypothetical protein
MTLPKLSVLSTSLLCLALAACGDDDGAPDDHSHEDGGGVGHAGTGSHAGSGGGDEAGSGGASVDSGSPAGGIEVAGMWMSMYGDETIDDMMWGGSAVISFDNTANEAITQGAPTEDDAGVEMDGTFSKIVWTEPEDGAFYYCFVAFLQPTAAAADAASMPADDSDPDNGGCGDGDFPWTKLELK